MYKAFFKKNEIGDGGRVGKYTQAIPGIFLFQ